MVVPVRLCLTTLVISGAVGLVAGQQPVFRVSVDLLPLLVSVLEGSGQPVTDIEPSDFAVTLDGKPRSVKFARFYGSTRSASPQPVPAGPPSPPPRSPSSNTVGSPGRVVVFVVDRESLRAGSAKVVLETAAKLLSQLTEADASGFIGLPVGRLEIGAITIAFGGPSKAPSARNDHPRIGGIASISPKQSPSSVASRSPSAACWSESARRGILIARRALANRQPRCCSPCATKRGRRYRRFDK